MKKQKAKIKKILFKNNSKDTGITVITLVITIIILLLLAGITINTLLGDNALIKRVNEAKTQTLIEQYKEKIALIKEETRIEYEDELTLAILKNALDDNRNKDFINNTEIISDNGINKIKLTTNDAFIFLITEDAIIFTEKGVTPTNNLTREEIIALDNLPPKNFIPEIRKSNSSNNFLIYVNTEDSEATEESTMSGIKEYDYYINGVKQATLTSNEYEIENINGEINNIYVIAYDYANNSKESYHAEVTNKEIKLINSSNNIQNFAFSNNNNNNAYKVFDGDTGTYWDGGNIDSYIGYDFVTATKVNKVKISQPYNSDVIRYFKIQYSDDGINYSDASNQLEYIRGNGTQTFQINTNTGAHRYWRYQNISNYTNNAYCAISELEFIKTGNIQSTVKFTNTETSSSTNVISNNNSNNAYKAFDNNTNTYWDGENIDSYLGYIFVEPVNITNVRISQPYSTDVIRYFKIQYSDDGINYSDASNQLEYIKGDGTQTFQINTNIGAHKYWRYQNISNYTNSAYCAISELEFLNIIKIE